MTQVDPSGNPPHRLPRPPRSGSSSGETGRRLDDHRAKILDNPAFERVGVGVSCPDKVGRDSGELVGARRAGVTCTDDVDCLIAARPGALVHFGPSAAHADDNIALISAFLRAGIDVCSTPMTPWVWPHAQATPREWVEPIEEACREGGASCFTTGIDPGFANDLLPITLMGVAGRVDTVRASELLDYTAYESDYEHEMGIGWPPEFSPILEIPEVLIMAWGGTIPMIAHSVGIELDSLRTEWEKWLTPEARNSAKGKIAAGHVAAVRFPIHGVYQGRDPLNLGQKGSWFQGPLASAVGLVGRAGNCRGALTGISKGSRSRGVHSRDHEQHSLPRHPRPARALGSRRQRPRPPRSRPAQPGPRSARRSRPRPRAVFRRGARRGHAPLHSRHAVGRRDVRAPARRRHYRVRRRRRGLLRRNRPSGIPLHLVTAHPAPAAPKKLLSVWMKKNSPYAVNQRFRKKDVCGAFE